MKHYIDIASNYSIYIDGERVVGRKPNGIFEAITIHITDSDLVRIVNRCNELLEGAGSDEMKRWYKLSGLEEKMKDGSTRKKEKLVFETTDMDISKRVEDYFKYLMDETPKGADDE